ncbi:tetratricopeptide repeat protein [Microbacterium sp. W1N]|uniref:tetratricopeptide repeat protein n=1 Tax=Microbacterium festucae TaxID=2977531 RepID=UPI0021C03EB6|nr:tetratricopeptide repeat protein [Microbacterium festucae]MCT9821515.1 tetratricopeptide repeat protein [Microbacterium festucae]
MSTRIGVAVIAAVLLLYIVLVGQRSWLLLTSGDGVGIAMGVALIVLPLIAIWALWREIAFGVRAEALGRRLEQEDALPPEQLDVKASGRPIRDEAAALFPAYREVVEQHPDDWRAWYRLGLVYDGAGDRRRARQAVRTAIGLERAERRAG